MTYFAEPRHFPTMVEGSEFFGAMSPESQRVQKHLADVRRHFASPYSRRPLNETVEELADTWLEEAANSSSMADMVLCPSYQSMIALGRRAVPYLLVRLIRKPDHWFFALTAMAGVNPIRPEDAGNLQRMRDAWIQWGERESVLD